MVRGSRLRQIGWAICIGAVFGGFMMLTFRVDAVKSEVVRAERTIVELEREKLALETEFETRANQQQLADWNAIEFGYQPPRADQFLESERQLASFSAPRAPGSPEPIRFAREMEASDYPALVSPLAEKTDGDPAEEEQGAEPILALASLD
ncbi:hypothetical protein [Alteriqipengyuania sp.]|uniref:hypothetical protein n=1 Tax=Alteriqipengyuania sp. TaxID=2800692 RepID=UPI0035175B12